MTHWPQAGAWDGATAERTLVAIAALPPGGGKSSLCGALETLGWAVVSSDEERVRGGSFDATLRRLLTSQSFVAFDKNLPDMVALAKLCKTLREVEAKQHLRIRLLLVAPDRLLHDVAWQRISARPADHISLSVHIPGGEAAAYRIFKTIFFDPSLVLLPLARSLPGATVTGAFWAGFDAAHALAAQLHARAQAADAPMVGEVESEVARRQGARGRGGGGGGARGRGGGRATGGKGRAAGYPAVSRPSGPQKGDGRASHASLNFGAFNGAGVLPAGPPSRTAWQQR